MDNIVHVYIRVAVVGNVDAGKLYFKFKDIAMNFLFNMTLLIVFC